MDSEISGQFWATEDDGCKSVALERGEKGFGFTVSSIGNKIASVSPGTPQNTKKNLLQSYLSTAAVHPLPVWRWAKSHTP